MKIETGHNALGVFLCKALTSKHLLSPLTAQTSHKQCLHRWVEHKKWCWIDSKALVLSPFVYFISLHI